MTHPTPEAVAAMIAELREWADNFPVSEPTFASAADLLAALSAERDALTERCGRAERERDEHATDDFDARQYLRDAVTKAESDLAAARATIAAVTKQREDADHDADLARSQLGSVAMDNADLRATIARLTAEVQAARKTTTFIETADGVYAVSIGTPKFCLLAKDYASAKERANEAREFAARARTNPKEPTT